MLTNDFKPVGTNGGAYVKSQADFLALATSLLNGMPSGKVDGATFNKILRQSSTWATVLGNLLNQGGVDALDDGNTANLLANLITALRSISATEALAGSARIASQTDADTGTDDAKIITSLKLKGGSSRTLANSGYIKLPSWLGGLMIVWGQGSVGSGGTLAVSFAQSFFATPYAVTMTITTVDGTARGSAATSITANGFTATTYNTSAAGIASGIRYIAIGPGQ